MELATAVKDNFNSSRPWIVKIAKDEDRGIKGGTQGPWKRKRDAQLWADKFNEIHAK